jgi:hypothetical protein
VIVHTCNSTTWEVEAGGWWVLVQPGIHSKTCLKKQTNTNQKSICQTIDLKPQRSISNFKTCFSNINFQLPCSWQERLTVENESDTISQSRDTLLQWFSNFKNFILFYFWWYWIEPMVSCLLGSYSTHWTLFPNFLISGSLCILENYWGACLYELYLLIFTENFKNIVSY